MLDFARRMVPRFEPSQFHKTFYELLNRFARGEIRKLMISVPPQHGKSLGTSTLLPAFMLGLNPDLRICIGSYSFSLARRFGLSVQRVIGSGGYSSVFPATTLKGMTQGERGEKALRTADEFDIVGADGGLRLVGRECSLTGNRVDVMILDDLYKDAAEANSPVVREAAWDWYTSVVRTRMHNQSSEIIVFTRWHEQDLIGRLANLERVVDINSFEDLARVGAGDWVRVNFEAIKTGQPTALDGRLIGEPLWPARHSVELLLQKQKLDPVVFEALYQGNPKTREGLLYGQFGSYNGTFDGKILNYTDTADMGGDKLCSVCYGCGTDGMVYIVDVVYTAEPMEVTEGLVARMLKRNNVRQAIVESNNGGRGFARTIQRLVPECAVKCLNQRANKESRILTNASEVMRRVVMPCWWESGWSEFARDLTSFRRQFRANKHDDAADVLTGIIETVTAANERKIQSIGFANGMSR